MRVGTTHPLKTHSSQPETNPDHTSSGRNFTQHRWRLVQERLDIIMTLTFLDRFCGQENSSGILIRRTAGDGDQCDVVKHEFNHGGEKDQKKRGVRMVILFPVNVFKEFHPS